MNSTKKIFTATVAALLYTVTLAQKSTCLSKAYTPIGYPQLGLVYNDWDYLTTHESTEYSYKMTGVQLCADMDGNLRGMEAFVGKYSNNTGKLLSILAMNQIGDVSGECKVLQMNPLNGEFIDDIIFRFGASFIDAISIGTNMGARIFLGNHPGSY